MPEQENTQAAETAVTVPDLFTGAFSIGEALKQLRLRLLDLTARNRLLNFKPSATKSLQVVDAVPNAVFARLLNGSTCTFVPIPDPVPGEYVNRESRRVKPDVREYARQIGVSATYELPLRYQGALAHGKEGQRLQALFYPEELERQSRRIAREAQSAIEETGTNMLYLVIGFLEFYESDDSERALNAPLVAVPVSLKRGAIDTGTLNITQRDLIEEILEKRLKDFDEGEAYKAKWENEGWPFFVKNLENVQGDERDVIYISTTFGKAPGTTVVRQNFGPISRPSGWRRLNVLFTRARKSLHVYSSMQPEDIVTDAKTPEGTKALRNYLEYASRGVLVGADITDREPDSDFEVSVAEAIRNKGFSVQPQLGVAGFFIDLAVRNPDRHGEFMAAIECDGATYHSGVSVRDRDRIRQEILESLGWKGKIWRIWSADWFRNPANEIRRLMEFLEARRASAAIEPAIYMEETQVEEEEAICFAAATTQLSLEIQPVDEDEELFVEVGDTVTYCDAKEPEQKLHVLITGGPSNFDQGIINEATPLAKTLLDSSEGDEVHLALPGKEPRTFKVLKVERNGKN